MDHFWAMSVSVFLKKFLFSWEKTISMGVAEQLHTPVFIIGMPNCDITPLASGALWNGTLSCSSIQLFLQAGSMISSYLHNSSRNLAYTELVTPPVAGIYQQSPASETAAIAVMLENLYSTDGLLEILPSHQPFWPPTVVVWLVSSMNISFLPFSIALTSLKAYCYRLYLFF